MAVFDELPDEYTFVENRQVKLKHDLIEACRQAWEARYDARQRRRRARDYFRGNQWEETTDPETGEVIDEALRIRQQNRIPWVMNEIRPIVNNLKGQFRKGYSDSLAVSRNRKDAAADEMLTVALEQILDLNIVSEVDAGQFLEDLLCGCFGWKLRSRWWEKLNRDEVSIDPVDQNRLFYNPDTTDLRGFDLRMVGELHDWTLDDVIASFAKSAADEKVIRSMYADLRPDDLVDHFASWNGFDAADRLNFYYPEDPTKARVIEVWCKKYRWNRYAHDYLTGEYALTELSDEQIEQINAERRLQASMLGLPEPELIEVDEQYEGVWTGYFLTPDGHCLWEGDTPYWHDEHPYLIAWAVLLDGEHWGMVDDIINPQRLMNRMTTSVDFMFGTASKGVLLVPEEAIPDDMDINDFAAEWSRFGGAIKFRAKPGIPIPTQVTANAIPAGIFQWLTHQRDWMEKISGVHGPVQGQDPGRSTPASLYQAQIDQGNLTNLDYFKTFAIARRRRDIKALQLILQFKERGTITSPGHRDPIEYDPERVRGLEFDVVIQEVMDTATQRMLWEQDLKEHLHSARITFRQYLELSSHPKADAIIAVIEKMNPVLLGQPVTPELIEAAEAGDPDAMAILQQAVEAEQEQQGGLPMAA